MHIEGSDQLTSTRTRPDAEQIRAAYPDALVLVSLKPSNGSKILTLESPDGSRHELTVSRFTYINHKPRENWKPSLDNTDFFCIEEGLQGRSLVKICDDGDGGLVQAIIQPYYQVDRELVLAEGVGHHLRLREVTTADEFAAVSWLNRFHYRSLSLWGRSTAITARMLDNDDCGSSGYVGYIMLNSAPILTRPRDLLLGWDKAGRLENVDRIVRIARVVVHPEFRGLGLGRLLVEAAIEYVQKHWNSVGKKPWLLETVAEMSKYHPVFLKAGMFQFGTTAGRQDVFVKPATELDHQMGPGHWRSSLDRMKMVAATPKPYYAAVLPCCPSRIRNEISERKDKAGLVSLSPASQQQERMRPPLIRFLRATLTYAASSGIPQSGPVGNAPRSDEISAEGYSVSEAVPALNRMMSVLDEIREEESFATLRERCGREVPTLVDSWRRLEHEVRLCRDNLAESIGRSSQVLLAMDRLHRELRELMTRASSECREVTAAAEKLLHELDASIENIIRSGATNRILWGDLSTYRNRIADFLRTMRAPAATGRQKEIASAFGVPLNTQEHVVLDDFSLDIMPGQVVLLMGASGSGKTSVLRSIADGSLVTSGVLNSSDLAGKVGVLDLSFPPDVPVIDLVGSSTVEACRMLNAAGISEARLYLKRRHELSHGQRYRVAAAILAASGKSVWLADEFCAFLDPTTASVVSSGMSKLARELGATFIASVADGSRVSAALKPDITVRLMYGGRPNPDVRLRYWKSVDDWCSRLPNGTERGSLDRYTRDLDLIYHRLATEMAMCGETSESDVANRLLESLSNAAPEWTGTTMKRQINLRLRLWKSLKGSDY